MRTIGTSSAFPALDALISAGKSNKEDDAARNKSQTAGTLPTGIYFMAIYLIPVRTAASPRLTP